MSLNSNSQISKSKDYNRWMQSWNCREGRVFWLVMHHYDQPQACVKLLSKQVWFS